MNLIDFFLIFWAFFNLIFFCSTSNDSPKKEIQPAGIQNKGSAAVDVSTLFIILIQGDSFSFNYYFFACEICVVFFLLER